MKNFSLKTNIKETPVFPEFKTFEAADRMVIEHYLDQYKPVSCEYSFANLFCWGGIYDVSWSVYNNRLMIYIESDNQILMPLGEEFAISELKILFNRLQSMNPAIKIGQVPEDYLEKNPGSERWFNITRNENLSEYIYSTKKLLELNGGKLGKKKNLVSQFKRSHPEYKVENMGPSNIDLCRELAERHMQKHLKVDLSIREEKTALNTAFDCFDKIGLEGLILKVGRHAAAFSIFSRLHDLMTVTHYEKSDFDFKGAAQVINQETARYLLGKSNYINREQDLGIPGLRQAKLSYCPDFIYSFYTFSRFDG